MAFPTDGDYTYAERYGRTGNQYATPIDESVSTDVVTALTSNAAYLEALTDKMAGDDEFLPALIAALVADDTFPEHIGDILEADTDLMAAIGDALGADTDLMAAIGDALGADTDYLSAITDAIATNLVDTYGVAVTGELAVLEVTDPVQAFDGDPVTTPSHTFGPVTQLGDQGVSPTSVSVAFLMSDDSTETFTDPAGDGVLVGSADGSGTFDYTTGTFEITWGTLSAKTGSEGLAAIDYSYLINAFEPEVVLAPASLAPIASEVATSLAADTSFLAAIKDIVWPAPLLEITVGSEDPDTDTILIDIQVKNSAGDDVAVMTQLEIYATSDPAAAPDGIPVDSALSYVTGVLLEEVTAGIKWVAMTDATGLLQLSFQDTGLEQDLAIHIIAKLPNGHIFISDQIVLSSLV